jgi:hypothetical protein
MARLPVPGNDADNWGNILNTYLGVAHNSNGTLKDAAKITGAQQTTQKGQANGYAGLDGTSKVPMAQLPDFLGSGDYIGVNVGGLSTASNTFTQASWDSQTTVRGSSLSWDIGDPTTIQVNATGVYAISLTVFWNDSTAADNELRFAEIVTNCGFYTEDRRTKVTNAVTQSLHFTAFLQPGQNPSAYISHSDPGTLTPDILMLVTRIV